MTHALHVHHSLIRRLIVKHKLYEVKTIGDSFMCAACSPIKAVDFAVALQREFFERDWGTTSIDTAYALQQEGGAAWGASHLGWNGLRVRVGIHYGMGEIALDPVSKGYDYYGTVVNTAARVKAVCHGGQIGITQSVYDALKGEFPGTVWGDLGEQLLRGLTERVHLYQVVPAELSERMFPPLRLERSANVAVEDGPPSEDSRMGRSSVFRTLDRQRSMAQRTASFHSRATCSAALAAATSWMESHPMVRSGQLTAEDLAVRYLTVLKALTTLLETQTQRVRQAALRSFCEQLHVRNVGSDGPGLEETLHGLVQRVLPAALSTIPSRSRHASSSVLLTDMGTKSIMTSFRLPNRIADLQAQFDLLSLEEEREGEADEEPQPVVGSTTC
eukprot:GGOE01037906.1.p1 GENE.GGOE01037906.1~~GGOE01037906.1.p1  ORF type:complete len:426 (-),score=134.55 GGOE01037906.1:85-1248(-)